LSRKAASIPGSPFDYLLADVPCSGSGTWGRNPERLYFYRPEETAAYQARQQSIITFAIPMLKKKGSLLYMTCSVFRQENEDMAMYITEKLGLQMVQQQVFKGYETRADTMFAALFQC
jgi:16S rRNA (cytosine967-C5)-methyltransferase